MSGHQLLKNPSAGCVSLEKIGSVNSPAVTSQEYTLGEPDSLSTVFMIVALLPFGDALRGFQSLDANACQ